LPSNLQPSQTFSHQPTGLPSPIALQPPTFLFPDLFHQPTDLPAWPCPSNPSHLPNYFPIQPLPRSGPFTLQPSHLPNYFPPTLRPFPYIKNRTFPNLFSCNPATFPDLLHLFPSKLPASQTFYPITLPPLRPFPIQPTRLSDLLQITLPTFPDLFSCNSANLSRPFNLPPPRPVPLQPSRLSDLLQITLPTFPDLFSCNSANLFRPFNLPPPRPVPLQPSRLSDLLQINLQPSRPFLPPTSHCQEIFPTPSLCRWFRFAQLAKGKKFRP
jgi:hypothetical protein